MEANVRDEGAWFVCAVPARRAAGNQIGEVATEFADDSSGAAAWIETDKGDFGSVKLILPREISAFADIHGRNVLPASHHRNPASAPTVGAINLHQNPFNPGLMNVQE